MHGPSEAQPVLHQDRSITEHSNTDVAESLLIVVFFILQIDDSLAVLL